MTSYTRTMREAREEMLQAESMSSAQIDKLKKAYEPMRDKRISTANANKLSAMMDKFAKDKDVLIQLFKADIPFVSQSAVTKLIIKYNMKGAELNKLRERFGVESVELDEMKSKNYALAVKGKFVAVGSKADMMKMKKQKGGEVYMSPGAKVGGSPGKAEDVDLDEALNPKDKKVVDAFYDGRSMDGKMLSTDGKKLEKTGMGGQTIASKSGSKFKIVAKMDSSSTQDVVKYIEKSFPKNVIEEVELDEASKFSNADFILGFAVPWAKNPTTQYEPHLVNYVKKLAPSGNREYAYKMVAQVVQQLINGGMPAIRQWLQQNKGYYDKMDSKVKKELMKGMKEEVDLDEASIEFALGTKHTDGVFGTTGIEFNKDFKVLTKKLGLKVVRGDEKTKSGKPTARSQRFATVSGSNANISKLLKTMRMVKDKDGFPIKEEVELDEFTVSDVEIAMKKKYGKVDKEAIEKLKKVQHMGNVDRNALVKVGHGKLHVESVDLDEKLDKEDEPKVKEIIKKLKGASQAHAGQAKDLQKAVTEKDELDEAVDKNAADELKMYIENDAQLYKSQLIPIVKNIQRKMKSGKYDHRKAPKLWMYLVDAAAKKYVRSIHGSGMVKSKFDKQTRQYVAQQMADEYKDEIEAQGGTMFEEVGMDEAYSPKQIKMAIGIASDPRYKGGNYSGAVKAIEKIKGGLSQDKQVAAVLKRQNEALGENLDGRTREYRQHREKLESIRSKRLEARDIDPADIDTSATDDDIKSAGKNIMMQLRKSVSLRGQYSVEFLDKKKVKVPQKIALAVIAKYNSLKKPMDKEKFQAKIAKSHKDLLMGLKESLDEKKKKPVVFKGTPKQIKQQMKNLKKKDKIKIGEESTLERMNKKLQEKKNG